MSLWVRAVLALTLCCAVLNAAPQYQSNYVVGSNHGSSVQGTSHSRGGLNPVVLLLLLSLLRNRDCSSLGVKSGGSVDDDAFSADVEFLTEAKKARLDTKSKELGSLELTGFALPADGYSYIQVEFKKAKDISKIILQHGDLESDSIKINSRVYVKKFKVAYSPTDDLGDLKFIQEDGEDQIFDGLDSKNNNKKTISLDKEIKARIFRIYPTKRGVDFDDLPVDIDITFAMIRFDLCG